MNFLEQLTAEWHQYAGYFVRTNIKFGRNARGKGGYVGEMDVIAYKPQSNEFIHIEASTDAQNWISRKEMFERKFTDARQYYMDIFPFKEMSMRPRQIAIVGTNLNPAPEANSWQSSAPVGSPWGDISIEVIHIPRFFQNIYAELRNKNPQNDAIPETYSLLRAIQYVAFYNKQ